MKVFDFLITLSFLFNAALVASARVQQSSLKDAVPLENGPVPPSATSSCTHIVGGTGDDRPCPSSAHQDAVSASSIRVSGSDGGTDPPSTVSMAKAPVQSPPTASSINVSGSNGTDPPSTVSMAKVPVQSPPPIVSSSNHVSGSNGTDRSCPP